MPLQYKIVIADTSCFILLEKIDEIELLKQVFEEVYSAILKAAGEE